MHHCRSARPHRKVIVSNRLRSETSPYLLQHAENPVDWFPWGEEAFALARAKNRPIFLSVGYSACHWCHVMEHESFEDGATAALMNERFVAIKVDREERPDVDAIYMNAVQLLTGSGGWPMSVFLTPDAVPFYGGTYFPDTARYGMPSFTDVLIQISDLWSTRPDDVLGAAANLAEELRRQALSGLSATPGPLDAHTLDGALAGLTRSFDRTNGGWGSAPKFPQPAVLEFVLRRAVAANDPALLEMVTHALDAMLRGGIYDQLGGGFHRYATDEAWLVPHFEKMLYDNALLLRVYAHWWRATASPLALRVVTETADWLVRELRTPDGGFASALDADSTGPDGHPHEGAFYAWTPAELREVLGDDDGTWAAEVFEVTPVGTFEHGRSVLQLLTDVEDLDEERHESVRTRLLEARGSRPRPARDDKVVAAWNGLAIAALADAGALLDRPDWVDAATVAAELLVGVHLGRTSGSLRLARTSRDGRAGTAPGVLEDYADTAEGLLALHQATGDPRWTTLAGDLLDEVLTRFADGARGFYDTAEDQTDPVLARIRRPRDPADGPAPSGQAAAAGALLTYAGLTGSSAHREAAERALTEPLLVATRFPRAAGWALAVAEAVLDGPREVAVVGAYDDPRTHDLRRIALRSPAPGLVLAVRGRGWPSTLQGQPGTPQAGPPRAGAPNAVALLADRPQVEGRPTAYVCRGFVCDRPTTDPAELTAQLAR